MLLRSTSWPRPSKRPARKPRRTGWSANSALTTFWLTQGQQCVTSSTYSAPAIRWAFIGQGPFTFSTLISSLCRSFPRFLRFLPLVLFFFLTFGALPLASFFWAPAVDVHLAFRYVLPSLFPPPSYPFRLHPLAVPLVFYRLILGDTFRLFLFLT